MLRRSLIFGLIPLALACGEKEPGEDSGDLIIDEDGDGVAAEDDCDDDDANVFPGNAEICDGLDNNCNDTVDEGVLDTFYADRDSDGFGDLYTTEEACEVGEGYVVNGDDCDDQDPDNFPGNTEVCDGGDNDCDGDEDEDDAADAQTWYVDSDEDGYGDSSSSTKACEEPSGHVDNADDCDDDDDQVNPDAAEICDGLDNDCDGSSSEDGMASAWDGSVYTDITSSVSGSSSSPAAYDVEGDIVFCDGTFYTNLDVTEDASISSLNGDATGVILDGAGQDSVVRVGLDGLTVTLSDLTVTNGSGSVTSELGLGGGGIACGAQEDPIDLTLAGMVVDGNSVEEGYGGGIFALLCDLSVTDSFLTDNSAPYGAGGFIYESELSIDGTEISGNSAVTAGGLYAIAGNVTMSDTDVWGNLSSLGYVGGLYFEGQETVDFDDVRVEDNEADAAGGVAVFAETFTWDGSGDGTSTCTGNIDDGEYAGCLWDGPTTITNVDFGTSANGDDNSPYDVGTFRSDYWVDDAASFSCDGDGQCGTSTTTIVGTTPHNEDDVGPYVLANVFLASTDGTLESFAPYTQVPTTSCYIQHFVMTASSATSATWDVVWADTYTSATTSRDYVSAHPGLPVEAGTYYALAWRTECSSGTESVYYTWESGTTGSTITDLGTTASYVYKSGVAEALTVGDSVSGFSNSSGEWWMEVEGTDL